MRQNNANDNNFNGLNHIKIKPLPKYEPTSEEPNCDNVEKMLDSLNNEDYPITHLVEKMMDSLRTKGSLITHFSGAYIKFTTDTRQVTTSRSYRATSESLKSFFLLKALEKKTGKNLSQIMALTSAPTFASTLASALAPAPTTTFASTSSSSSASVSSSSSAPAPTFASISSSSSAPVINMQVLNILTFLTTRLIFWEENLAHLLAEMGERLATETNISQKRLIEMLSFSHTSITSLSGGEDSPIVTEGHSPKSENNILHIAANSGNYEFIKAILNNNYSQFLPSLLVSSNSAAFTPLDLALIKSKVSASDLEELINNLIELLSKPMDKQNSDSALATSQKLRTVNKSLINQLTCISLLREGLRNLNQTQVAATPPFPTQATTAGNGSQEHTITKNCFLVFTDHNIEGCTTLTPANVPYNTTIGDILNTLLPSYSLSNTTMGSAQVPTTTHPKQSQFAAAVSSSSRPNRPTNNILHIAANSGNYDGFTPLDLAFIKLNALALDLEQRVNKLAQFLAVYPIREAISAVAIAKEARKINESLINQLDYISLLREGLRNLNQTQVAATPPFPTQATTASNGSQEHTLTKNCLLVFVDPKSREYTAIPLFNTPYNTTIEDIINTLPPSYFLSNTTMGSAHVPTTPPFQLHPNTQTTRSEQSQFAAAVSSSSRPYRPTHTTMGSAQAPTSTPPFQRPHEQSQFAAAVSSSSGIGNKRKRERYSETMHGHPPFKKPRVMIGVRPKAGNFVVKATHVGPDFGATAADHLLNSTPIVKIENGITIHPDQTSASGMEISH
jgi:hypothetical protein